MIKYIFNLYYKLLNYQLIVANLNTLKEENIIFLKIKNC